MKEKLEQLELMVRFLKDELWLTLGRPTEEDVQSSAVSRLN